MDLIRRGPDVSGAAKSGDPAMTNMRPTIPASIPQPVAATTGTTDVSAGVVTDSKDLDTKPDARLNPPAATGTAVVPAATGLAAAAGANTGATTDAKPADTKMADPKAQPYEPLPSNYTPKKQKAKKKSKKTQTQQQAAPAATTPETPPKVVDATSTATQKPE
jgi:hypothetical protein